uniref:(northern house mosquito) hypothetical protein n=1 Tax=Culex pipiens TaxID=7175 RepID=A0A8D8E435_CULPI
MTTVPILVQLLPGSPTTWSLPTFPHCYDGTSDQPAEAPLRLPAPGPTGHAVRVRAEKGHPQVQVGLRRPLSDRPQLGAQVAPQKVHPLVGVQSEKVHYRVRHGPGSRPVRVVRVRRGGRRRAR